MAFSNYADKIISPQRFCTAKSPETTPGIKGTQGEEEDKSPPWKTGQRAHLFDDAITHVHRKPVLHWLLLFTWFHRLKWKHSKTYHEAIQKRYLLDNQHRQQALRRLGSAARLRTLFAAIMCYREPANTRHIWDFLHNYLFRLGLVTKSHGRGHFLSSADGKKLPRDDL